MSVRTEEPGGRALRNVTTRRAGIDDEGSDLLLRQPEVSCQIAVRDEVRAIVGGVQLPTKVTPQPSSAPARGWRPHSGTGSRRRSVCGRRERELIAAGRSISERGEATTPDLRYRAAHRARPAIGRRSGRQAQSSGLRA